MMASVTVFNVMLGSLSISMFYFLGRNHIKLVVIIQMIKTVKFVILIITLNIYYI